METINLSNIRLVLNKQNTINKIRQVFDVFDKICLRDLIQA